MTKRKNIEIYSDALTQWELAVTNGGLILSFPTLRGAIAARHRLYRARAAYFDLTANPQYNDAYIQLWQNEELIRPGQKLTDLGSPAQIIIRLHSQRSLPQMTDLNGNPIDTTSATVPDPLTSAALALRKKFFTEPEQ